MGVRLLIASHHLVVREGLVALLEAVEAKVQPVGTATSPEDVLAKLDSLCPDVVLLDMQLSNQRTTLTGQIKTRRPGTRVVILSPAFHDTEVCRELADGAEAVVPKTVDAPELIRTLLKVPSEGKNAGYRELRPEKDLSNRETDVLECVAHGMSNSEIAFALSVSLSTVKAHVEHILRKLGASDRASAVAKGFRRGLIE